MDKDEPNKHAIQQGPWPRYLGVAALIGIAALALYGRIVWPFIHGRMVKENISFFEAASSEHILIGGLVGLVIFLVGGWFWASRN